MYLSIVARHFNGFNESKVGDRATEGEGRFVENFNELCITSPFYETMEFNTVSIVLKEKICFCNCCFLLFSWFSFLATFFSLSTKSNFRSVRRENRICTNASSDDCQCRHNLQQWNPIICQIWVSFSGFSFNLAFPFMTKKLILAR